MCRRSCGQMVSDGAGNKIIMRHMSILFRQSCLLGRTDGVSLVFLIGQPDLTLCVGCRNLKVPKTFDHLSINNRINITRVV